MTLSSSVVLARVIVRQKVQHRLRKPVAETGWYNTDMSLKLSAVNPYLRDPVRRARTVLKSVASSSAIEGIRAPFKKMMRSMGKPASVSASKGRVKS